jgi:hypothetical protein
MVYSTIEQVKRANNEAGSFFFSKDTMRFFASRVLPTIYKGRFFLTTEKACFNDPTRVYNVREAMPGGDVRSAAGPFTSKAKALKAMQALPVIEHDV